MLPGRLTSHPWRPTMDPRPSHSTPTLHERRAANAINPPQKGENKTTHHPRRNHFTKRAQPHNRTMNITIQPTSVWDIRPGDPIRHMHSTWIVTQTHHHGAGFTIDLQRTDRKRMPRLLRTHWTEDLTLDLVTRKDS